MSYCNGIKGANGKTFFALNFFCKNVAAPVDDRLVHEALPTRGRELQLLEEALLQASADLRVQQSCENESEPPET
jgi:hypothetical protein